MSEVDRGGTSVARSALAGAMLLAFTLLLLTDGRPASALSLLKGAGLIGVLTGLVTLQLPALLPTLVIIFLVLALTASLRVDTNRAFTNLFTAALSFIAALFLTPRTVYAAGLFNRLHTIRRWTGHLIYVALVLLILGILVFFLARRGWVIANLLWAPIMFLLILIKSIIRKVEESVTTFQVVMSAVCCLLLLVFVTSYKPHSTAAAFLRPWLPAEQVSLTASKSGNSNPEITTTMVGYVLGNAEGWMTIMKESDRTIIIVPSTTVTARAICRVGPDLGSPHVLLRRPHARRSSEIQCPSS